MSTRRGRSTTQIPEIENVEPVVIGEANDDEVRNQRTNMKREKNDRREDRRHESTRMSLFPPQHAQTYDAATGVRAVTRKPIQFFDYWFAEAKAGKKITVTVYRSWPMIDMKLAAPGQNNIPTYIAKFTDWPMDSGVLAHEAINKEHYVMWALTTFGTGKYVIWLNDAESSLNMVTLKDWEVSDPTYPPKLNIKALIHSHPSNASYVQQLRAEGVKFPGDPGYDDKDKENTMSENILTGVATRLIERKLEEDDTPQGADSTTILEAVRTGMDLVRSQAPIAQPQMDIPALLTTVIAAANNASGRESALLGQLISSQQAQAEILVKQADQRAADAEVRVRRLEDLINAQNNKPQPSLLEQVKESRELLEALNPKPAKADEEDDMEERISRVARKVAPDNPWIPLLTPLIANLPTILGNVAAMVMSARAQPQYTPPVPAGVVIPPGYRPSQPSAPQSMPQHQSMPPQAPPPNVTPINANGMNGADSAMNPPEDPSMDQISMFVNMIAQPLSGFLSNGTREAGMDFAAWLSEGYGLNTLQQVQALKQDIVIAKLLEHRILGPTMRSMRAERLDAFLSGFFEWTPESDEATEEKPS